LERRALLSADLVADINPGTLGSDVTDALQPVGFQRAGGRVYYQANDGIHGDEVWTSDGTAVGTRMVADLSPGPAGTRVQQAVAAGGLFFFVRVVDTSSGFQFHLWRTDGTEAGTFKLADSAVRLVPAMGRLFYTGTGPGGVTGLYSTDGTAAGTTLVRAGAVDAFAGTNNELLYVAGGTLYRYDGSQSTVLRSNTPLESLFDTPDYVLIAQQRALKILDKQTGELAGTVVTDPSGFTALSDGRVVFVGTDGQGTGRAYVTDGTVLGTKPVNAPGGIFRDVGRYVEAEDGSVYFSALVPGVPAKELFRLPPGSFGAALVKDIAPGLNNSSAPGALATFGGRLYFAAGELAHGYEIWSTDGTEAGTRLELDLHPGPADTTFGGPFVALDNRLLFIADTPRYGRELYQLDPGAGPGGTSAYHLVGDANRAGAGMSYGGTGGPLSAAAGGRLVFPADDVLSGLGLELWSTDGTAGGTRLVKDLTPGSAGSGLGWFTSFGPLAYFTRGGALWATDGTEAGTQPQGSVSAVTSITPAGGKLFVGTAGKGLWVVDAPGSQPRQVFRGTAGPAVSEAQAPRAVGDALYFVARDGSSNIQVWRSNGTDAGTGPVTSFGGTFTAADAVAARGQYFFLRDGGLWATDGTAGGTRRVGSFFASELEAAGDLVYASNGDALFRTDGTEQGTTLLKQFLPGSVQSLAGVGDRVFFAAADHFDDPVQRGRELWTSDGTAAGTVLVKDVRPGTVEGSTQVASSDPRDLTAVGGTLFFSADDGVDGRELWQSDGTPAGTILVRDIYAGATPSNPSSLGRVGDTFYFTASDFDHGLELWRADAPRPAGPTVTGVFVSGTAWSQAFKEYLRDHKFGSADSGFAVPAGSTQLVTLPWTNLDRISISFSAPVQVDASDLRVRGVSVADYTLDPSAFSYDAATRTATWRLAGGAMFSRDRILLDLDGDSPDGVRSAAGSFLDGDWINPVGAAAGGDAFPSGDGTPGGDFRFRINVLPGDVNRYGSVLADDFSAVKKKFFKNTGDAATGGDADYSPFHDVNGDGVILAFDYSEVKKRFFSELPDAPATVLVAAASGSSDIRTAGGRRARYGLNIL
jgi:ELWxxDGT repeat protein